MAHLTLAASERGIQELFGVFTRAVRWQADDSSDFGPFTAGYDVAGHLEGGTIELRADNTIRVRELDIKWDTFEFNLGFDIPEICVGGGCINLPWPLPDICLPRICVFSADPDISVTIDLAPFIAQEVSFTGSIVARHFDASAPPPAIDPCAWLRSVLSNNIIPDPPDNDEWQLFIDPESIDLDLFDFADIVGDLFEDILTAAIEALIPGGWVRDLILAIIGGIADLIRTILDIPDDFEEWLSDLLNVSFGLLDTLLTIVGDVFGACVPFARIEDPFPVLDALVTTDLLLSNAPVTLVPVRIPIENLSVNVDDDELVVQADIGA